MKKLLHSKPDIVAIFVLIFISAFFRFFLIHEIPCGLFPDQAFNGLDALDLQGGLLSPVYNRREGLIIYLVAISQMIFGTGIWQIFIVSAFIGTLTVVTTYIAVKEIFNRQIAFLSGFFLAVSSWHIALSRNGFRAISIPLIITLFSYFLIKAFKAKDKKQEIIYYSLTSSIFALGFYTYNAYWVFAYTIFAAAFFLCLKDIKQTKKFIQQKKKAIIYSVVSFSIIVLPITLFVLFFPEKFFARAAYVSIFAENKGLIETSKLFFDNFWRTLLGIFHNGDTNWRHNSAGSALIHPLLAPFFIVTLLNAVLKNRKLLFLFFIFLMMFLPAILTSEGTVPHSLRLIGIIPILFVIPVISISNLLKSKEKRIKTFSYLLLTVIMISATISGYKNYFVSAPVSKDYYIDFSCDLTQAADYIKAKKETIILTDYHTFRTIRYLLHPMKIKYKSPEKFIEQFDKTTITNKNIIVLSTFAEFNTELLTLLSENFQKEEVRNKFGDIDFYIFSNDE